MTTANIVFLTSAVSVSLIFLIVLSWAEKQTRDL